MKLGKIRMSYEARENPKGRVEVLIDGKPVCELPATAVTSKIQPGSLGTITIDLIGERIDGETMP